MNERCFFKSHWVCGLCRSSGIQNNWKTQRFGNWMCFRINCHLLFSSLFNVYACFNIMFTAYFYSFPLFGMEWCQVFCSCSLYAVYVRARVFNAGLLARSQFASGRSCDRPTRSRFSVVFLGPRANVELVPKFHVALHAFHAALQILTFQNFSP
jgi:hypothetical protein